MGGLGWLVLYTGVVCGQDSAPASESTSLQKVHSLYLCLQEQFSFYLMECTYSRCNGYIRTERGVCGYSQRGLSQLAYAGQLRCSS